ncbi:hypothetical protein GCM10009864_43710 [Streptomyces lunalinharesii]|uniref:Uncharacterized protein n=1 Tax=Streptomyces lunalinharesii TaxID=333384 RepID=A0ABN3S6V6_9ACTN
MDPWAADQDLFVRAPGRPAATMSTRLSDAMRRRGDGLRRRYRRPLEGLTTGVAAVRRTASVLDLHVVRKA